MVCLKCGCTHYSFDHRCEIAHSYEYEHKSLVTTTNDELNHFYYDELQLSDSDRDLMHEMGISDE